MIVTALAAPAARKLLIKGGIGLALIAAVLFVAWRIYSAGFEAGKAEAAVTLAAARLEAEMERSRAMQRLHETERAMREIEQRYTASIEQARQQGRQQSETVRNVIHEHPAFADTRRPADLHRLREQQLRDLAAAAQRSAELSGAGLRTVPAPGGTAGRANPGRDGSDRR